MSIETTLTVALMCLLLGTLLLLRGLIGLIRWIAAKLTDLYAPGHERSQDGAPEQASLEDPERRVAQPAAPAWPRSAGLGGALIEIGQDLRALAVSLARARWKTSASPGGKASADAARPGRRVFASAKRGLESARTTARDLVAPPRTEAAGGDPVQVLAVESAEPPSGNGHAEVENGVIVLESWDPSLDDAPTGPRAGELR
jgi:hypothetical protein